MTRHAHDVALNDHDDAFAASMPGRPVEALYGDTVPVAHPWAGLTFERA